MPDPARLRDSTQIVLPCSTLEGIRGELTDEFLVTIDEGDEYCRIIASPVIISDVGEFLTDQGIPLED